MADQHGRRLSAARIEGRALVLFINCQSRIGPIARPPVPVDEILEKHLGLSLELDDIKSRFGLEATDGVTIVASRQVFIDERLDPVEHPEREGRFNFTIAHEIGHWVLHRHLAGFEPPPEATPWLIGSYAEFEWQADRFAAGLLMPASLVRSAWRDVYGSDAPVLLTPNAEAVGISNFGSRKELLKALAEDRAGALATRFKVSVEAMRIRLEQMKLVPAVPRS